jgi:hypothetical protein
MTTLGLTLPSFQLQVGDAGLHRQRRFHRIGRISERGHDGVSDDLDHCTVMVTHDRGR